jgi:hypothetical protein
LVETEGGDITGPMAAAISFSAAAAEEDFLDIKEE